MRWLALLAVFWWAASWLGLRAVGLTPVIPTSFLLVILMQLPFACVLWATTLVPRYVPPIAGILIGVAVLFAPNTAGAWPWFASILLFVWLIASRWRQGAGQRLLAGFVLLVVASAAIWNSNYLALWTVGHRLWDATLLRLDVALFGASSVGMYPLVHSPLLIRLLERAYVFAFTELMAVVLILAPDREALTRFMGTLLICYALALAVFIGAPVVGPGVVFPDSNRSVLPSQTAIFQQATAREFNSIRSGGQPATGFAYFVGAPSLHVAIAVLVWLTIRRRYPFTGWMLVPLNGMIIVATVVLGHHYVLDAILGLGLPALGGWVWVLATRPRRNDPAWASANRSGA